MYFVSKHANYLINTEYVNTITDVRSVKKSRTSSFNLNRQKRLMNKKLILSCYEIRRDIRINNITFVHNGNVGINHF